MKKSILMLIAIIVIALTGGACSTSKHAGSYHKGNSGIGSNHGTVFAKSSCRGNK